jgi:hypothetical protein
MTPVRAAVTGDREGKDRKPMLSIIVKYTAKALAVVIPFLAPWLLGFHIVEKITFLNGHAPEEMVRAFLSLCVAGVLFGGDVVNLKLPQDEARRFGRTVIADAFNEFQQHLQKGVEIGRDVRVNVMIARRVWWLLYLRRTFDWYANRGFAPDGRGMHRDNRLFLFTWQGICGKALGDQTLIAVDLREMKPRKGFLWYVSWLLPINEFRLFGWQTKDTAHVQVVVSIPIFRLLEEAPNERWKVVGVINIDAVSDLGAAWLSDTGVQDELGRFFKETGTIIAFLAS